jgi:poly(A) polymerase
MRYAEVRRMRPASLRRLIGNPLFDTELELHRLDCGASHHDLGNHAFLVEHRRAYADKPVLPAPWVTGADLMALGLPCGKAVGHWKQRAYDAQLEGRCHSREALLQWIAGELHRGAG